jgi:hypothetical protein
MREVDFLDVQALSVKESRDQLEINAEKGLKIHLVIAITIDD